MSRHCERLKSSQSERKRMSVREIENKNWRGNEKETLYIALGYTNMLRSQQDLLKVVITGLGI